MTDKERKRRRMEIERRMGNRRSNGRKKEQSPENLFLFRTYITVILAGSFLVVSFFQTPTSEKVCQTVKETIGYQISEGELSQVKEKAISVWKEIELPSIKPTEDPPDKTVYQPDLEASP